MHDWVATTLRSVQLFAVENGFDDLANEMDVAILVAAKEHHRLLKSRGEQADVEGAERHSGDIIDYPGTRRAGRGH